MTTVSEDGHMRRCFVGDISQCTGSEAGVDELFAETRVGNVTVLYDDEVFDENTAKTFVKMSSGLFGRLFSRWG